MDCKVGSLYLVAAGKGLQGIFWDKQPVPMARSLKGGERQVKILSQAVRELKEYFDGKRKKFGVPLDAEGTLFQKRVWTELRRIPYGKTYSYRDIANRIKNGKAVRAVGSANGKNPLCIIVPCHRVIAADGTIGGYSGGLDKKIKLLEIEHALPSIKTN